MSDLPFLDDHGGESLDDLLDLEHTYRIESLVFALDAALNRKLGVLGAGALSRAELVLLIVHELECQVNNGGFDQYFFNSSREHAGEIEAALRAIGCPLSAAIAQRAVNALAIPGELTPDGILTALAIGGEELFEDLGSLTDEYYERTESIADELFAFVKANRATISLGVDGAG